MACGRFDMTSWVQTAQLTVLDPGSEPKHLPKHNRNTDSAKREIRACRFGACSGNDSTPDAHARPCRPPPFAAAVGGLSAVGIKSGHGRRYDFGRVHGTALGTALGLGHGLAKDEGRHAEYVRDLCGVGDIVRTAVEVGALRPGPQPSASRCTCCEAPNANPPP